MAVKDALRQGSGVTNEIQTPAKSATTVELAELAFGRTPQMFRNKCPPTSAVRRELTCTIVIIVIIISIIITTIVIVVVIIIVIINTIIIAIIVIIITVVFTAVVIVGFGTSEGGSWYHRFCTAICHREAKLTSCTTEDTKALRFRPPPRHTIVFQFPQQNWTHNSRALGALGETGRDWEGGELRVRVNLKPINQQFLFVLKRPE
ncbi:unnamed protein product [Boreogadus saida]